MFPRSKSKTALLRISAGFLLPLRPCVGHFPAHICPPLNQRNRFCWPEAANGPCSFGGCLESLRVAVVSCVFVSHPVSSCLSGLSAISSCPTSCRCFMSCPLMLVYHLLSLRHVLVSCLMPLWRGPSIELYCWKLFKTRGTPFGLVDCGFLPLKRDKKQ